MIIRRKLTHSCYGADAEDNNTIALVDKQVEKSFNTTTSSPYERI